jgi:hypothetical protein
MMRIIRRRCVLALFTLIGATVLYGCATAKPRPATHTPPGGDIITAADIRKTGATSAWEALKYTVRTHQFQDYRGTPVRITSDRGVGSMVLREEPLIFLDGTRLVDIVVLRGIPANNILYVQVLNAADGTTYYGTSATAGVILIETTLGVDLEDIATDSVPPDTTAGL